MVKMVYFMVPNLIARTILEDLGGNFPIIFGFDTQMDDHLHPEAWMQIALAANGRAFGVPKSDSACQVRT